MKKGSKKAKKFEPFKKSKKGKKPSAYKQTIYSLYKPHTMKINTKTHNHPLVKQIGKKTAKYSNPNVLYGASGKPYKSTSSGVGWVGEKPVSKKK